MPWSIKLKAGVAKSINKLDKPVRDRVRNFLNTLAIQDNPRVSRKALQEQLAGYWRCRVGDYRLICQVKDKELIILVIELWRVLLQMWGFTVRQHLTALIIQTSSNRFCLIGMVLLKWLNAASPAKSKSNPIDIGHLNTPIS